MAENNDDSFSSSKAEVFEALGHPTRIRILQELASGPLTYSELKRAAGMESNGLLTFHLGKMRDLVRLNPEGNYALTDEGKEALRIVEASRKQSEVHPGRGPAIHLPHQKAILAGLLVALIVVGSVAVYQQSQITSLSHEVTPKTATILGQKYWYLTLPLSAVIAARSIPFDGVNFTATVFEPGAPNGSVSEAMDNLLSMAKAPCVAEGLCAVPVSDLPDFIISFGAGVSETFTPSPGLAQIVTCHLTTITKPANGTAQAQTSVACISAQTTSYTLWISQDTWLSEHAQPQAGIHYDTGNASLTFYVSLS